jgi:hypothetical protein
VCPEQLAVVARRVLLDGLDALRPHIDAITVIGAQAVYLRTPHAAIASAAYTSDGDLGVEPTVLGDEPLIDEALKDAGFSLKLTISPASGRVRRLLMVGRSMSGSTYSSALPSSTADALRGFPRTIRCRPRKCRVSRLRWLIGRRC